MLEKKVLLSFLTISFGGVGMEKIRNKKLIIFLTLIILLSVISTACGKKSEKTEKDIVSIESESIEEKIDLENEEKDEKEDVNQREIVEETKLEVREEENKEEIEVKPSESQEPNEKHKDHIEKQDRKPEEKDTSNREERVALENSNKENIVYLEIIGCPDKGIILESVEVEVNESDTVFEILQKVTRENKIHMDFKGRGSTSYVEGIDNLYEFDKGPGSGWMYSVNGKFPNKSSGVWPVNFGDVIKWHYTEDLGRDLGISTEDGLWDGREDKR